MLGSSDGLMKTVVVVYPQILAKPKDTIVVELSHDIVAMINTLFVLLFIRNNLKRNFTSAIGVSNLIQIIGIY